MRIREVNVILVVAKQPIQNLKRGENEKVAKNSRLFLKIILTSFDDLNCKVREKRRGFFHFLLNVVLTIVLVV